jgi:hypothetical protein
MKGEFMLRILARPVVFALALALWMSSGEANERPPVGILAASAGNEVLLADPTTGETRSVPAGPVAWLFPAPGGVLFAPDLVNGKTTVIDLRALTVREPLPGITMPHFGTLSDRYLVLDKQLLVVSYPDRALMNGFEISFENPWQVEVLVGNTVLLVLERLPEGGGDVTLTAVSLSEGRLVYRRSLPGDVRHFAVSPALAMMALAQAETDQVVLADPATLTPAAVFPLEGSPVDLVFADDGSLLVVAVARPDGGGELAIWRIKLDKKKGLQRKKEWTVQLAAAPVRLVSSPDGRHVAAALTSGELQVFELEHRNLVATSVLPEAPRDVVWCDPSVEGPVLPDWSDDDEPTLNLGGR